MTQRISLFSCMSQMIELFLIWPKDCFLLWLKETNTFLNTTERNEHFEYDSKNWTFFFFHDTKSWTSCQCDSKSWTFFPVALKELNFFFFNMTQELNPFCHSKELNLLLFHDAKNWTHFFGDSMEHSSDPKNWTFFLNTTHRIELFFWNVTPRIEPDFQKFDSKNWIWLKDWTFFQYDPKNRTHCWMWLKVLNFFPIWPKESNTLLNVTQSIEPSSKKDSKNWPLKLSEDFLTPRIKNFCDSGDGTFFFNWNQRIKRFFNYHSKMMDPFFEHDSLNWTLLIHDSQNYTWKTHRDWTLLFNTIQRKWVHF